MSQEQPNRPIIAVVLAFRVYQGPAVDQTNKFGLVGARLVELKGNGWYEHDKKWTASKPGISGVMCMNLARFPLVYIEHCCNLMFAIWTMCKVGLTSSVSNSRSGLEKWWRKDGIWMKNIKFWTPGHANIVQPFLFSSSDATPTSQLHDYKAPRTKTERGETGVGWWCGSGWK